MGHQDCDFIAAQRPPSAGCSHNEPQAIGVGIAGHHQVGSKLPRHCNGPTHGLRYFRIGGTEGHRWKATIGLALYRFKVKFESGRPKHIPQAGVGGAVKGREDNLYAP
jgi:hypothetical protein